MWNSLRVRLTIIFIALAVGPLVLVGALLVQRTFSAEQAQAVELQQQVAQRAAAEIAGFIQERESELLLLAGEFRREELDRAQQISLILSTFSSGTYQSIYEEFALLDGQGQEQFRLARLEIVSAAELRDRSGTAEFQQAEASRQTYFGPAVFDEGRGEALMTIAVPLFRPRSVQLSGVLIARVRFSTISRQIGELQVSEGQTIYVTDAVGKVVAHQDRSLDLRNKVFEVAEAGGVQTGLAGEEVILAADEISIGEQRLMVVAEKPAAEALTVAYDTAKTIGWVVAVTLALAVVLGLVIVGQIVRPIEVLAKATRAISAGDLSQRAEVVSQDELGELAHAFNSMAAQLQEVFETLEKRVLDRTQRLALVAAIGERLTAFLDLDELLREIVNQVKDQFDFYHVHIYLLDETGKRLVMVEGTGEAGEAMKAQGHSIPLLAPASLVARAARSKGVVLVDNVREAEDWLPNPHLPETRAEMAVPIILEGRMVGVLDVQEVKAGRLDEDVSDLLRSVANQVALVIRNARQFTEIERALAQARAVQEQYLERAWDEVNRARGEIEVHYQQPGTRPVDEALIRRLKQEAARQSEPVVAAIEEHEGGQRIGEGADEDGQRIGKGTNGKRGRQGVVLAPIRLLNQTIGGIQLYQPEGRPWSEQELAVVRSVAEQVAQVAENLRLFEETRERASQERVIREITDKLRAAPNLDALLETAARELGQQLGVRHTILELGIETEGEMEDGRGEGVKR